MQNMTWPRMLPPGGTIGICSPAGSSSAESLAKAVTALESRGYKARVAPYAAARNPDLPYLAGTDDERIGDLNRLLRDPEIDLVLCARGGYGCGRLLDRIDYDAIHADPKPLVGYSDITALSLAIAARAGVVTFSGPMASSGDGFGQDTFDPFSEASFFAAVGEPSTGGIPLPRTLRSLEDAEPWQILRGPDTITGALAPVCLSLLLSVFGTPYCPDLGGAILVIEDVHEELYAIDRALTQLRLADVLDSLAGILIGSFNGLSPEENAALKTDVPRLVLSLTPPHVPVATGVAYGHIPRRLTLPFGARTTVDLRDGAFSLV